VTVNEAVRALRKHVGKTQQIFATELGIAISSLNNYERQRTPEPKQLFAFSRVARDAGRDDLAEIFFRAAKEALGWESWYSGSGLNLLKLDPSTPESWYELACIEALERCLSGASDYQDLAPIVLAALAQVIERQSGLQEGPEEWARFEEESVRRGYAFRTDGKVRWTPMVKRSKKQQ
jgi:transcriptional regulator with XRE-family HTH domain